MRRLGGSSRSRLPAGLALSIRQPWAWAIAEGYKDVENRSWSTTHRGKLLIHASTKLDQDGLRTLRRFGIEPPDELEFGALVARVRLVDVVTDSKSPWAERGLFHFLLDDVTPIRPIACRGNLGLFQPEASNGHRRQPRAQDRLSSMSLESRDAAAWLAFVHGLGLIQP